MAKKRAKSKRSVKKNRNNKTEKLSYKVKSKSSSAPKDFPTLNINKDSEIAMDFATKAYERFNKIIKSVVLFGSTAKADYCTWFRY